MSGFQKEQTLVNIQVDSTVLQNKKTYLYEWYVVGLCMIAYIAVHRWASGDRAVLHQPRAPGVPPPALR